MRIIISAIILCIISSTVLAHTIFPEKSDDPKVKMVISQLQLISCALENFLQDNGFFPTTEQGIKALYKKPAINMISAGYSVYGYIEEINCIDPWGNDYIYRYVGKENCRFILMSNGADGKKGGKELDSDIIFIYNKN
ncbi:MAG: type II secretion system protein GspG [Spirochaetes bacterium]|nr:type II secretion system protein GspG [Spirochaetota bacterium]